METFEIYTNSQLIFTVTALRESDAWAWLAQTKSLSIKQTKDLYKIKTKQNDKRTILDS